MKPLPKCNFPVLLVDDDLNALELTRKLLLKAGFGSVHTISDSRETIPFLKENDVVSVRGLGKFIYTGTSYQTKKGRYSVKLLLYT